VVGGGVRKSGSGVFVKTTFYLLHVEIKFRLRVCMQNKPTCSLCDRDVVDIFRNFCQI
jgi:hypothetical protein